MKLIKFETSLHFESQDYKFDELKELRKAGKLEEALAMALPLLEEHPNDIWCKINVAWIYYEYLKKNTSLNSIDTFKEYLAKINELKLPEDQHMLFDSCAWKIGSVIFSLHKQQQVDHSSITTIWELIKNFHFTRPSEAYSFLFKAFHKGHKNWTSYVEFAEWWNFENFSEDDFKKQEFNGNKIISIVEQATIAYSKKLLEGDSIDEFEENRIINKDKIESFLPFLDQVIQTHPEYQYPPYFKAKLLLAIGDEENVLSAFLPFAKQKQNDFWVWELMTEIFPNDKDIQLACYCKALSLKTPEDFLVKLRQNFAALLIEKGMYDEAKFEIEKVVQTREKNEWNIPAIVNDWQAKEWYKAAKSPSSNESFYLRYSQRAEEILFSDIKEETVVVEFVNQDKDILSFVKNRQSNGFFNYSKHLLQPKVGDVLKIRIKGDDLNGFCKVLTAKKAEENTTTEAMKDFEGSLKIIEPHHFGFVDEVFVEPKLVKENQLEDKSTIIGKAILSFNKKKDEWGWKAIAVSRI